MTATAELQLRRLQYRAARSALERAIADAELSCRRLEHRLAVADRRATRAGDRLRVPGFVYEEPARPRQRSSTTISVAHATAS